MVDGKYWLIIDRVHDPRHGRHWLESRFHTFADVTVTGNSAQLTRNEEQLTMTFASLDKALIQESRGLPSLPRKQTQILRWMSAKSSNDQLQVTALNPGSEKLKIAISKSKSGGFTIQVTDANGKSRNIEISSDLQLK